MREALNDIRVIDLTRALAGPYATMLLADMGAEVIKVEKPEGGDTARNVPHTFHPDDEDQFFGGYFNSINRNKKSIAVDLKTDEGTEIVKELVETADVLVENFRRGVMERLGLGYEELSKINPGLVYSAVTGYGDPRTGESSYQAKPLFDVNAQAIGGVQYITSPEEGGPPTKIGPGIGDLVSGMYNAFGIMSALWHRKRTGEGQMVDTPMYDSLVALCQRIIYTYSYQGEIEEPPGNKQPLFAPFGLFRCKDGHISIAAPSDHHWEKLCEYMDKEELLDDPRFETAGTRVDHYDALLEAIEDWTTDLTKQEIFERISDDVPCAPVNTAEDIFEDPHIRARNMLATVEQPIHGGMTREVQISNTPIRLTKAPGGVESRAPDLGTDTETILEEIGYSRNEIQTLDEKGVITPEPMEGGMGL